MIQWFWTWFISSLLCQGRKNRQNSKWKSIFPHGWEIHSKTDIRIVKVTWKWTHIMYLVLYCVSLLSREDAYDEFFWGVSSIGCFSLCLVSYIIDECGANHAHTWQAYYTPICIHIFLSMCICVSASIYLQHKYVSKSKWFLPMYLFLLFLKYFSLIYL